jgi:hypothetical protein
VPASYQDTFSGSGDLNGSAIEIGGVDWSVVTGTWSRVGGAALTSTAATSNPIAVVDVGWGDVDISLDIALNGGGDCIYFRVVDSANWLRLRRTREISGTLFQSYARLDKCVAGTVTQIGAASVQSRADFSHMRVVASGATITVYLANQTTNSGIWTDTTNATATKHGIGRGDPVKTIR